VGFESVLDDAGDYLHATATISRRRDIFARNQIFQVGFWVARYYAPVGATFLGAFEWSRSKTLATIHAAHRVNRICFVLIRDDTPFVNQSTLEAVHRRCAGKAHAKRRAKLLLMPSCVFIASLTCLEDAFGD